MRRSSARAPVRRRLAALVAVALAVTGLALVRAQVRADADTVQTNQAMNCPIIGALDVPVTATDTPELAVEGGPLELAVIASAPVPPGISVTIETLTLHVPLPSQVASVDDVTFTGGNMAGSFQAAPGGVDVVLTGPVGTDVIDVPTAHLHVTIAAGTAGQTISWPGPSGISTVVSGLGTQDCTAVGGNPEMQATPVLTAEEAATTTTTVPTPTATTGRTTTTAAGSGPSGAPTPVPATPRFTG